MKKMKIAFWILVFAFLGLIIYQNIAFFRAPLSLQVNLAVKAYETPEFQIWVYFIGVFILGILLTYLFSLPAKFRVGKSIRTLNATIASQRDELGALKNEVAAMRSPAPAVPAETEPAPVDTDKVEPQE
ncbi:MAG: hypothetical protein [Olavius algarvensis Delta 4 endosymbiont]|nr:MAG: hypothetical protein [Olavius algarvensis Delta 4 endosymbiont]